MPSGTNSRIGSAQPGLFHDSPSASSTGNAHGVYIHGLDALRGIAALLVVLFHFDRWALPNLHLGPFDALIANGYIWVDFFFILSGFVMTHVYRSGFVNGKLGAAGYREFLGARLARIYPLHFMTLMILVGLELAKLAVVLSGRAVETNPSATASRWTRWSATCC